MDNSKRENVYLEQLKPGDIICVLRKLGYYHYGVFVEENMVIHFSGDPSKNGNEIFNASIIITSLEMFLRGGALLRDNEYSLCKKFTKSKIIERAFSCLGSNEFLGKPYNFVSNNCEHFASWCATGEPKSSQVEKVLKKISSILNFFGNNN